VPSTGLPCNYNITLVKLNQGVCCDRLGSWKSLLVDFDIAQKMTETNSCLCMLVYPSATVNNLSLPGNLQNKNNASVRSHFVCVSILVTSNIYKQSPWMSFACNSLVHSFSLSLSLFICPLTVAHSSGHLRGPALAHNNVFHRGNTLSLIKTKTKKWNTFTQSFVVIVNRIF